MKKIRILIASFLLGLCILTYSYADEKVAMDLVEYVNQGILNIGEMETKSLEKYSAVIGKNYTTDEAVYMALKDDVIPLYKRFYLALREIRPGTDEVMKLHQIYVRGVKDINERFRLKKLGLQSRNNSVVEMDHKKIEAGSEHVKESKNQLLELCKKHGVAPKDSEK